MTAGNVEVASGGGTGTLLATGADSGGGSGGGGGAGGAGGAGADSGAGGGVSLDPKPMFEPALGFRRGGRPGGVGGTDGVMLDLDSDESFPIDSYQLPPPLTPPLKLPSMTV